LPGSGPAAAAAGTGPPPPLNADLPAESRSAFACGVWVTCSRWLLVCADGFDPRASAVDAFRVPALAGHSMIELRAWRWSLSLLLGSASALGCRPPPEPVGALVGVYAIDGSLTENTCGQMAFPTKDPLRFEVEIRQLDQVGYWQIEKRPAKAGELELDGAFRFTNESTSLVSSMRGANNQLEPEDFLSLEPDFDLKTTNCAMKVREVIEGSLTRSVLVEADGGGLELPRSDAKYDLSGDNTIDVSPTADSDCSESLAARGGMFENLPCSAHYSLRGTLQKSITE
jgi:hypothetical protein